MSIDSHNFQEGYAAGKQDALEDVITLLEQELGYLGGNSDEFPHERMMLRHLLNRFKGKRV